jgi:hypothetical protein
MSLNFQLARNISCPNEQSFYFYDLNQGIDRIESSWQYSCSLSFGSLTNHHHMILDPHHNYYLPGWKEYELGYPHLDAYMLFCSHVVESFQYRGLKIVIARRKTQQRVQYRKNFRFFLLFEKSFRKFLGFTPHPLGWTLNISTRIKTLIKNYENFFSKYDR